MNSIHTVTMIYIIYPDETSSALCIQEQYNRTLSPEGWTTDIAMVNDFYHCYFFYKNVYKPARVFPVYRINEFIGLCEFTYNYILITSRIRTGPSVPNTCSSRSLGTAVDHVDRKSDVCRGFYCCLIENVLEWWAMTSWHRLRSVYWKQYTFCKTDRIRI